ncbi:hypothetical protein GCM10023223_52710 [Stackebrandtia albiflava]
MATALVVAAAVAVPAPAYADQPTGWMVNRATGQCAAPRSGDVVVESADCGVDTGHWRFTEYGAVADATGRTALTVDRADAGAPVTVGGDTESVTVWRHEPGTGQWHPQGHPELAVAAEPELVLRPWSGAPEQRWDLRTESDIAGAAATGSPSTTERLPTTGTSTTTAVAVGAAAALTGAFILIALRARRRLLQGSTHW